MSTKYYEKTIESLRGANRSKLKTKYKLSKVNTCNPRNCFETTFLCAKDILKDVILETPFIGLIQPFTINNDGLKTKRLNQEINFEFIYKSSNRDVNF